ncbi:MAG: asparaginase [Luteibaculum sp.]
MTPKIALLYTGGTIGMSQDPATKKLVPLNFEHLNKQIPELDRLEVDIVVHELWQAIDSSDFRPAHWLKLANKVVELYDQYDGFVILHGTDTMAYTASALSFLLQNLGKPVILTGSQLPIGVLRTDGKENIISAIEIAAAKKNGLPIVPEVCIYFEYKLLRGNRSTKISTEHFDAFKSPNYPVLAEAGVNITYFEEHINQSYFGKVKALQNVSNRVISLKLFPGINPEIISLYRKSDFHDALILEGFGTGNTGTNEELLKELEQWCYSGKLLAVTSQCVFGSIYLDKYASSARLSDLGALNTQDETFESIVTKLMIALGNSESLEEAGKKYSASWSGERREAL